MAAKFDHNLDVPFSFFAVWMIPSFCICLLNYWWHDTCLSPLTSDEQGGSVMPAAHSTPWQSTLVVKRREVTDNWVSVAAMENDRLISFQFWNVDKVASVCTFNCASLGVLEQNQAYMMMMMMMMILMINSQAKEWEWGSKTGTKHRWKRRDAYPTHADNWAEDNIMLKIWIINWGDQWGLSAGQCATTVPFVWKQENRCWPI